MAQPVNRKARISRVFVGAELVVGDELTLDKAQSHYLKHVLRLTTGAAVDLFNGYAAIDYRTSLNFDAKQVIARIETSTPVDTESPLDSTIVQGLGRADHMDWMIQKTTELGVNNLSLFNAERSQHPLKPAQLEKKMAHWRAISISACEQCGRALLPTIEFHSDLTLALEELSSGFNIILDFDGAPLMKTLEPAQPAVSILLGPEGGLNPEEIQAAQQANFKSVHLGARVLRFETAAVAALALVQSSLGDLG